MALDDDDIAEKLRRSVGRFVRAVRARADTVPPAQATALGTLDREGPRTIAELAAAHRVKHQSMSRTVGDLEGLGLVSRSRNERDGRSFLIAITPAGTEALEGDRRTRRRWLADTLARQLTPDERRVLLAVPDLLDRLSEAAERSARPRPGAAESGTER
ncbi:MarR family winged helix-turn-helix transcriptional regulator [Streptomyces corynorhini]|uniref:MarR family transcriptional regulator n=1 Tax=Streptomyces corynorhini TaxID=2282652 RepID=A0A370BC72_9ACTN|nr:MarR family transcriptional regulator [Streptomyces corynorhini]RDG37784.1 MarR family transcriptional regulator [Streptomyces corynorhini]